MPGLAGDLLLGVEEVISPLSVPRFGWDAEVRLRGHDHPFWPLPHCHVINSIRRALGSNLVPHN